MTVAARVSRLALILIVSLSGAMVVEAQNLDPEFEGVVDGDEGIAINGLVAMWESIPGAEAIRLEVEDEDRGVALKVDLPGDATTFSVPDGWLLPGVEYVLDIKAIAENGNQTVADLRFTTAR